MPEIYFNSNTLMFLPQLILTVVWVLALTGIRKWQAESWLLLGKAAMGVFVSLSYFIYMAIVPPTPWVTYSFHGTHIAMIVLMIPALQLAYHTPFYHAAFGREARYVFWGSTVGALGLGGLTVLYFLYPASIPLYPLNLLFVFLLNIESLWTVFVFLRSARRLAAAESDSPFTRSDLQWRSAGKLLRLPADLNAQYSLAFALAYLFLFFSALSLFFGDLVLNWTHRIDNLTSALSGLFFFCFIITYVNYEPQLLTLMRKLTLVALSVLLILVGGAGYLLFPVLQWMYVAEPPVSSQQQLRFSPNQGDGYDVTLVNYQFEPDLGQRLDVDVASSTSITLDFAFPFYSKEWNRLYVHANGLITFGNKDIGITLLEHRQAAIAPWLASVDMEQGTVYANQKNDRVIITWWQVPDHVGSKPNTFQVVLGRTGTIDFVYKELQPELTYGSERTDGLWLIGLLPGDGTAINESVRFDRDLPYSTETQQAVVQNVHLGFRAHVDQVLRPLALLVLLGALIILIGFPLLFRIFLIRPLDALMVGVRAVNQGNFEVRVRKKFNDELGFLTQSFNGMVQSIKTNRDELQILNSSLEEQIDKRTEQLVYAKEEAESANRAKSTFLTNMSHELRTPLNSILGFSQSLARDTSLKPHHVNRLDLIQQSGQHLLSLINDLLDLTKIETGNVDYRPEWVHLHPFLAGVVKLAQFQADQKGLHFGLEVIGALPDQMLADERMLRQVLLNLLANAIKFTDGGEVTLQVTSTNRDAMTSARYDARSDSQMMGIKDAEYLEAEDVELVTLRFSVADTGPGIDPGVLSKLGQPFFQGEVHQNLANGTGLGLSISQRLLQLMDSLLYVESDLGQGTTFWFDLAGPILDDDVLNQKIAERTISGYRGLRQSVLIVDDIANNRLVLADMLEPLGFDIVMAVDGHDGVAKARLLQPTLILIDLVMPGMDGYKAVELMRQDPALRETIIVAISASAFPKDQVRSLAVGCNDFLPKPVEWSLLQLSLREHLNLEWVEQEQHSSEWPKASVEKARLTPNSESKPSLSSLPLETIEALRELARRGDMVELVAYTANLRAAAGEDRELALFLDKLEVLANDFDDEEIIIMMDGPRRE